MRTRGGDTKYRLTVEELQLFANQLETLPARVAGHEGVAGLLQQVGNLDLLNLMATLLQVANFQQEANHLLEKDGAELEAVEKCLERGEGLEIELLEVARLRAKAEQLAWQEEVQELLQEPAEVNLEAVRALEAAGLALQPHPAVERGLGKLAGLRTSMETWETRAAACLAASPKQGLAEVERLVAEGESLSASLPSLDRLRDSCRRAREWWSRAEALQKPENYPYLDTLEALVGRGRPLPVRLEPLQHLETQVASARAWRERTARVFLKKNSYYNLLEVLSPRYEFETGDKAEKRRKKRAQEEVNTRHPIFQGLSAAQLSDPQEIVNAFKQAEQAELVSMREVRVKNQEVAAKGGADKKTLLDCELCREKFGPGAVPLPRAGLSKRDKPSSLRSASY